MKPAPEPADFDAKVRKPGLRAIAEMVGKQPRSPRAKGRSFKKIASRERDIPADRFPAYWTAVLDELMSAYGEVCAYSCFRIHPVTGARSADHFAPKSREYRSVYEWSNYRLCCARMNARKSDFGRVHDPFLVDKGAFRLELIGFQVHPNPRLPRRDQDAIDLTIDHLGLNDGDLRKAREDDFERYQSGDISLQTLKMESPFVAVELHRQKRLRAGDRW